MKFDRFIIISDLDYSFLKKFVKREQSLCDLHLDDLTSLRYVTLKRTIPELFKEGKYDEAIYEILKDTKKKVTFGKERKWDAILLLWNIRRVSNFKKYGFLLWVFDQYEIIKGLESKYLSSPPDVKLLNAGIRELDVLGDVVLIDTLSGGDILKWDRVIELPYSQIFDKLMKNTIEYRISKRLNEQNKPT